MNRSTLVVPAALVAVLAGLNLAADAPVAHAESEPAVVPASAFLTGPVLQEVSFEGVVATLTSADADGVTLTLRNPGDALVTIDAAVEVWEQRGSMMSRMGPIANRVDTHELVAELAPHGTQTVTLPIAVVPAEFSEDELMWGSFATTDIALRPRDAELDADIARLRVQHEEAAPTQGPEEIFGLEEGLEGELAGLAELAQLAEAQLDG